MLPIKKIEDIAKKEHENHESFGHRFMHIERTSKGAIWFVKILGGDKREQDLAYVAGLLHDIERPNTEKICHAKLSAEKARKILTDLKFQEDDIARIVQAIQDHRKAPEKWDSPLHQAVYLADKLLEQMGAYVLFRRNYYIAECDDYEGKDFDESAENIENHFQARIDKFPKTDFPEKFWKIWEHQQSIVINFLEAFKQRKVWAVEIAKHCFTKLRSGVELDDAIQFFQPTYEQSKQAKQETVQYIDGDLEMFEKFI